MARLFALLGRLTRLRKPTMSQSESRGKGAASRRSDMTRSRRKRGVSMEDVAQRAGVSAQTVSRVTNGFPGVRSATRERVQEAMAELGYRPNSVARALRLGEYRTLGVVVFDLANVGNSRTVEAIATAAAIEGYAVKLLVVDETATGTLRESVARVVDLSVDAVITILERRPASRQASALAADAPIVVVGSQAEAEPKRPVVDNDQAGGARLATEYLLDHGHETVWHVAGPLSSLAAAERQAVWRRTLRQHGRRVPALVRGDWSVDSGFRAGVRLGGRPDCTAVFAANDQMALGVMRGLARRGRRVPEDVSVVGFDDVLEASLFTPPLTTVHQDFAEVGRQAVAIALDLVRDGSARSRTLVPTRLIVRQSSGPVPGRALSGAGELTEETAQPA